jgi:soluble lytic murein transglycosylase-like protein
MPAELPAVAVAPEVTKESIERQMILAMAREYRRLATHNRLQQLVDAIYEESVRAAIDPLLVASIVAQESSFRDWVVSPAGAVGLMQIRPFVAADVAQRRDLEWHGEEALGSPAVNLRLGILYYQELVDRFEGDPAVALTAYNYGPTRVSRWLRDRTYAGSKYAVQVLSRYNRLSASRGNDA